MNRSTIHFEQLMEEARSFYPNALNMSGTEQPLRIWVDGQPQNLEPILAAHSPVWLETSRERIQADGQDSAIVTIHCPELVSKTIELRVSQGNTHLTENIPLDSGGNAEVEIYALTSGKITIQMTPYPVRVQLTAI
jgi:hypothetical protein